MPSFRLETTLHAGAWSLKPCSSGDLPELLGFSGPQMGEGQTTPNDLYLEDCLRFMLHWRRAWRSGCSGKSSGGAAGACTLG